MEARIRREYDKQMAIIKAKAEQLVSEQIKRNTGEGNDQ